MKKILRTTLTLLSILVGNLYAQQAENFKTNVPVIIKSDTSKPIAGAAEKKLIFLDFYNESNDPNAKWLADSIGESIFELTKNKYRYTRLNNQAWQSYAASKGFTPKDFYDVKKLQAMGFALKADGIIFGKFTTTPENISISGKILSVVDREIVAEKNITVPFSSQMFEDVQDVSETLGSRIKDLFFPSDRGALWRSALLPGWGQFYKQRKTWGYIYSGAVGAGAAFSLFSFIIWQQANHDYKSYDPDHVVTPQGETGLKDPAAAQSQFSAYQTKSAQWQQITLISFGITMAIYLWQLFDAWLFEGSYIELNKATARNADISGNLLGAVRVSSGRDPMSLQFSFGF